MLLVFMNIAINQKNICLRYNSKHLNVVVDVVNTKWPHQILCFILSYKNKCDKLIDRTCLDNAVAQF